MGAGKQGLDSVVRLGEALMWLKKYRLGRIASRPEKKSRFFASLRCAQNDMSS